MNDDLIQAMKPSQVISKSYLNNEYYLYLHGEIGSPDNFLEHFALYRTATANDVIFLYVNSNGGSLATGMEYIRHMRECEAPIVCILGMEVASMASAIALEANDLIIDDMSTMLVHSFSYGAMGTEYSIYNQATFNKKLNERWIRTHYSNFLDETQLQDALKGVDILLDSDEIKDRWANLQEYRNSQPCNCGDSSCPRSPENMALLEDEEDFENVPTLEDLITAAVQEGVSKALTERDRKEAQKARKKPSAKTQKALEQAKIINEAFKEAEKSE